MASVMTIRDREGNIIDIPVIKGPPGNMGPSGKITDVTASVDNATGIPGVIVSMGGTEEERTIDLAFTNLKGERGLSGIYVGTGDMPDDCNIQIDPDGAALPMIPIPTSDDTTKAIVVDENGGYVLGDAGSKDAILYTPQALTEEQKAQARENIGAGEPDVSADNVTAGTFAGAVKANAEAVTDLTMVQVRNVACGTADVADVLDSLNVGDLYFTVEEAT